MGCDKTKRKTIGVCGHKDIVTSKCAINKALELFWNALAEEYKSSSFHLLDSLAEGGDQYVLESKPSQVSFTAVLPFARELYEDDFETPEAKEIYRNFLNSAESVVVAGDEPGNYIHASEYLLENSDMILALWDCVVTKGTPAPGGSYDTISKALAKNIPVIVIPAKRKKTYPEIKQDIFPEKCVPLRLSKYPRIELEEMSKKERKEC